MSWVIGVGMTKPYKARDHQHAEGVWVIDGPKDCYIPGVLPDFWWSTQWARALNEAYERGLRDGRIERKGA